MKVKIKLFTQARKFSHESEFTIQHSTVEATGSDLWTCITLHEQEIEIEVPEFDDKKIKALEIEKLEKAKSDVLAASQEKAAEIDDKIKSLLD